MNYSRLMVMEIEKIMRTKTTKWYLLGEINEMLMEKNEHQILEMLLYLLRESDASLKDAIEFLMKLYV